MKQVAQGVRAAFNWRRIGNNSRSLIGAFVRMHRLVEDRLTKSAILLIFHFVRHILPVRRSQGVRGLCLYLKASSVAVMRACAKERVSAADGSLGAFVALTRSGFPRWLPKATRVALRRGDVRITKRVLTLCALYRVLEFKGSLKLSTITDPMTGSVPSGLIDFIPAFLERLSAETRISKCLFGGGMSRVDNFDTPLVGDFFREQIREKGFSPFLINKAGVGRVGRNTNTSTGNLISNAYALYHSELYPVVCKMCELFGPGFSGIPALIRRISGIVAGDPGVSFFASQPGLGALHGKDEAAGKVRVFAVVDWWTQQLLFPVHSALFAVLGRIREDATFDQGAGVGRVSQAVSSRGLTKVFSFDLSAATDRLPRLPQRALLDSLWPGLGPLWEALLVGREYILPDYMLKRYSWTGPVNLTYSVGQPMGAYSSWAMLAWTHHLIVQYAAHLVGYKSWFHDYMVLGDDIVIYHRDVAFRYLSVMRGLGVSISLAKSVRSRNGSFEFAKRYLVRGVDASPVAPSEAAAASADAFSVLNLVHRHTDYVSPASYLAFLGRGYRVRGRLSAKFSKMSWSVFLSLKAISVPGVLPWSAANWTDWFGAPKLGAESTAYERDILQVIGLFLREHLLDPPAAPIAGTWEYLEALTGLQDISNPTLHADTWRALEDVLEELFKHVIPDEFVLRTQRFEKFQESVQMMVSMDPLVDGIMERLDYLVPPKETWELPEPARPVPFGVWASRPEDRKVQDPLAVPLRLLMRFRGRPRRRSK